ncbi:MAG: aspartate kinase, partial [Vicinamibacterales bacterium]
MKVMKFGGTSVADQAAIERLIALVRAERQAEAQREGGDARGPVVVVSALSGVTDRLLGVAAMAGAGDVEGAYKSLLDLRERHITVCEVITDPVQREAVLAALHKEFDAVDRIVHALAVLREVSPRWLDSLAATGEILSSQIVAAALTSHQLLAGWVDSRQAIVTDGEHTTAAPLFPETTAALMAHVDPPLAAGRIPVLGGFVGATTSGVTTTLGRGGSDFSAAIVGACLGASEIQIWTDVDGMLTADPRIVAHPQVVPHLSFAEASELAYFGAKVLHPATIQPAVARNIPVRILNSHRAHAKGTLITGERPPSERPLTAVASKKQVTVVDITSTR